MNRCCPPSHIPQGIGNTRPGIETSRIKKRSVEKREVLANPHTQDTFLSASYFLAMLLTLGAFPILLKVSREFGSSETLLSAGCFAIATLVLSVVSFLYYSEQDARLKMHFARLRVATLGMLPLLFWWAFNSTISSNYGDTSFEWAVVFGLCSSLILFFIGFVIKLPQKQLLTCYLFLSAALCIYGGIQIEAHAPQQITALLWASGGIGGLGFVLQTQSEFRKKCQNVEWLLLLSVMLQACSLLFFGID